jgi:hypothetical protein
LKVKDHKDLLRDPYSKAIINSNTTALIEHRKAKSFAQSMVDNTNRITSLESDLKDIKKLLMLLVEKTQNS